MISVTAHLGEIKTHCHIVSRCFISCNTYANKRVPPPSSSAETVFLFHVFVPQWSPKRQRQNQQERVDRPPVRGPDHGHSVGIGWHIFEAGILLLPGLPIPGGVRPFLLGWRPSLFGWRPNGSPLGAVELVLWKIGVHGGLNS